MVILDEIYERLLIQAYENTDCDLSYAAWCEAMGYKYKKNCEHKQGTIQKMGGLICKTCRVVLRDEK